MNKIKWINPEEKLPVSGKRILIAYENSLKKKRIIVGNYTAKYMDENYDMDGEFFDYDETNDVYYLPMGWYENSYEHDEYSGYYLECQEILYWAELPEFPVIGGIIKLSADEKLIGEIDHTTYSPLCMLEGYKHLININDFTEEQTDSIIEALKESNKNMEMFINSFKTDTEFKREKSD